MKTQFRKTTAWLLTLAMLFTMLPGFTLTASAANGEEAPTCICGSEDAVHATDCPAYVAPENPECFCAEKCTVENINVWCDVCGVQGVAACEGEDTAATYAFNSLTVGGVDALTTSSGNGWSYNASSSTLTITGNIGAVNATVPANAQDVLNITVTNNATVDGGIFAGGKLNLVVNSGVTLTVNSSGDSHAIASGYHGVQDSVKITGGGTVVAISNGYGDGIKSGGGLWIEGVTVAAQGCNYGLDSGSGRLYIKDNSKVYAVSSQDTAIVAPSSAGHDVVEISGENTVVVAGFALGSAANNYVPTIDTPSNSSIRTGTLKVNCGHLICGDGFSVSSFNTGSMVLVSHSNYAEYVSHLTNYQQNSDGTHTPKCINGCPVPTTGTAESCSGTTYCNGTVCDKCGQTSGTGDGTSHKEGTAATCTTLAVCEICTQTYGELDSTNHTGSATGNYTYVDGTYHSAIFDCCNVVGGAKQEHESADGDITCDICNGLMLDKVLEEIANASSGTTLNYSGTLGTEANPDSTSQVIMTIPEGVTVNWDVDAVVNMSRDGNIRYYPLSLSGGGTLNLTGSIKNQGSSPSVTLASDSTVTLVVKNDSVVECAGGTAIAVYGGKLIVEGGTVSGASTYESSAIALNYDADVTITGGTVTAGYYVIHHSGSGKVAVSGDAQITGTYTADNWGAGIRIENAGTAEVSGSPTIKHTNGRGIFAGDDGAIIIFRAGTTAIVTGNVYGIYNGHVAYEVGANPTITGNTADTSSITTCSGGAATCKSGPICSTCGITYGAADADAHTGGTATCASGPVCTECGITYEQPDATHHVWGYTVSGATITAACTNAGCGANGGSFTLQAPENLVYDGSEKTVTVDGTITGVTTPEVSYSGDRTNVTTGGFTASITLNGQTASATYTITQKSVTIAARAQTITYGEKLNSAEINAPNLISGHKISSITLTASTTNVTTDGTITASGAKITDGSGADVTANYEISYINGNLTINPKSTTVTAPANVTLDFIPATVEAAIAKLPTTVSTTDGNFTVTWSCDALNTSANGTSTFKWEITDAKFSNYTADSTFGTITVTNGNATAVNHTGTNKEITYNGNTYDVSQMFTVDTNAGEASYEIVTGGTGAGTINGSALTITKAGTIKIKLTTAAKGNYAAGEATATLTVKKAAGSGTVTIEGWTYGETAKTPVANGTGSVTYLYTGTNYSSADVPTDAGEYTVTATFAATDLYEQATNSDTFTIKQKEVKPSISGTVSKTYDGTNTVPDGLSITLDGMIKNDAVSATASYAYDGTDVGTTKVNATGIALTGDDSGNYKLTATTASADVGTITAKNIASADIAVNGVNASYTYTGNAIQPTVTSVTADGKNLNSSEYEVTYGTNTTVAQGGSVIVELKGNYSGEKTVTFTILASDQADFSISGVTTATYGDPAITLNAAGGSGTGAITWRITSGDAYAEISGNGTTATLTIKGAGTVVVEATKASDSNYNAKVDTHTIVIGKATVDASDFTYTAPSDLVYSKTAKEATVTGDNAYGAITIKYYSDSSLTNVVDPINVGTYYVGITTAGGDNYEALSKTLVGSFTITARPVTVTADAQSRKYGEDNPTLTYTHNLIDGDSFSGALTTTATKTSDVGEYNITIGDLANSNYSISFTGAKLTITKADGPAAPTVTGSYKDNGMTYTYTIDVIEGAEYSEDGTTWQDSNVFENLVAGQKYTFYARIKETKNYNPGAVGTSAEVDLSKLPGVGTVTIGDWTYGENAQAPVTDSTTGNAVESYLYESTDGKGYSNANAPTNAGEYKLTVTFAATATHNGTTASDTFTIKKATPVVDAPTGLTATYGDTLADVQLETGWAWKDAGTTEVGNAGENTFTVIYTHPTDAANHNQVEKTVTIAVSPKVVTAIVTVVGENFIFNGSKQKPGVTVKDGETPIHESEYTVAYTNNINAGTATVTITDKDGGNYIVSGTATFEIGKKASSALSGVEREFLRTIATTGNEIDVEAMLPDDHGDVTYTVTSSGYTVLENVSVDQSGKLVFDTKTSAAAASDTITVKVEMQNYTDVILTVSVILNDKAPQEITGVSAATGLIYNGKAQQGYTGTPTSDYTGAYEITYTGRDNTYNSSVAPTNAGDYTVTFKIPDSDLYYSGNVSVNFTIGKAQATVTADDKEAYIGNRMPELTYKVSGLIGDDTISVELSCDANMNRAGETPIVVSATDPNGNYEITTVNGTLTVKYYPYIPPIITPTYPPVVDGGDNGDVVVTPKNPEKGDTVTITPDPDAGYEVDDVIVTDENGNPIPVIDNGDGTYSFKQPSGKVTITVTFAEIDAACPGDKTCPMYGYTDLDRTAWYHDGVHFCIENDLMNGTGTNTFAPGMTTSRAMIVTILWRLEGEPTVNVGTDFSDVENGKWYSKAIKWAAANNIVNGYGNGLFGPDDVITREQLATILYRYEQYKGGGFKGMWMFRMDYVDLADVSDWAYEAMCWMNMNGIVNGKPGKVLDPKGSATRAEAATMLYRYCEVSGKEEDN